MTEASTSTCSTDPQRPGTTDSGNVGKRPLRVAVIGAGPAGIYASDILVKSGAEVSIDIFDDLPAPYGLIRYGVSPDHPRIKDIMDSLRKILDHGDIRFLGNVRYGRDVNLPELRRFYDAIVFATGADRDAAFDIPGADLKGIFGAADFVKWYDGHPDVARQWGLDAEQVAVIGNGNVALDITRMLSKHADDLLGTEIPDNVYQGFKSSAVKDIHIFGRRGPQHVKFTPLELRELERSRDVDIVLDPADFDLSADDMADIEARAQAKTMMKTFMNWLASDPPPERESGASRRRLYLHFWHRPAGFADNGEGAVAAARFERTAVKDGVVAGTGEFIDYPVQAVYKAVGYFGTKLPGLPYDEEKGVIRHQEGRIVGENGSPIPGLYTTGWIKRGPVGLIGSTKSDALETTGHLLEDRQTLNTATEPEEEAILYFLAGKDVEYTTLTGWNRLEQHEKELGAAWDRTGHVRERIKVVPRDEMLRISRSEEAGEGADKHRRSECGARPSSWKIV